MHRGSMKLMCREVGMARVIAALTPFVTEVFNISRLNMVHRIFNTTEAAITELTP